MEEPQGTAGGGPAGAEEERSRARRKMDDMQREFEEMQDRIERKVTGMLPEEFVSHMRAAQKEWLLAMRSLIDAGVEKIDERERRRHAGRARKIEVE